jgi:hypothetical protein
VDVREVNILDDVERTVTFGVFSTPFIVINGMLAFVGVPPEAELRASIGQPPD